MQQLQGCCSEGPFSAESSPSQRRRALSAFSLVSSRRNSSFVSRSPLIFREMSSSNFAWEELQITAGDNKIINVISKCF